MRSMLKGLFVLGLGLALTSAAEAQNRGGSGGKGGSNGGVSRGGPSKTGSGGVTSHPVFGGHASQPKFKQTPGHQNHTNHKQHGDNFDYHTKHGSKFSHGFCYKGSHHCHWSSWCWSPKWGCYHYWCPATCCYYYWYAPGGCFYPVTYIEYAPPVF
jgi:hypothetical protein